jgi:hypothetical protein
MVNRRASGVHADIHVLDVEARRSVTGDPRNADFADIRCTAGVGDIWRGAESFALDRCAASCWRKHIGVGASWVVEFERKNRVSTSISVACSRCLANGEFTADNKVDRPAALRGLGGFLKQPKRAPWLILAEGVMPFNGHLLITYAIGKGPIALVSALGGARPIFVFSMTAIGARFAPGLIYEKFTRADMALKLVSATMVVGAVVIISLAT